MNSTWKPGPILLATDFSRASGRALEVARSLARQCQSELVVLHVFTYSTNHRYAAPVPWMISDLRKRARISLARLRSRLVRSGCQAETILVDSAGVTPASAILGEAQKHEAPILVLGTHSKDRIERFLIGSTAEEILRNTDGPVVTTGPNVGKQSKSGLSRLMLATDLSERSLAPVQVVPALVGANTTLLITHVSSPDEAVLDDGWKATLNDRLKKILGTEFVDRRVQFEHVVGEPPAKIISQIAREHEIDLLLIGMHRGRSLSSHMPPKTGFQVIMSAPCPVLSVCF